MGMDHATLHSKIREFESRLRRWRHLRFGIADSLISRTRRSTSQDPRKPPDNNISVSAVNSPAHKLNINGLHIGSQTSPMQRKPSPFSNSLLKFPGYKDPLEAEKIKWETMLHKVTRESGYMNIKGVKKLARHEDMIRDKELGHGAAGNVYQYSFQGVAMAVKIMIRSDNPVETKRIVMDLMVISKANFQSIVHCYGYFLLETEVWVCMELLTSCLDRILRRSNRKAVPEEVVRKINKNIVEALDYLKEKHNVMHRDVKPSNILVSYNGNVKLCDFGISGELVHSLAQTISAGCPPYMPPERLDIISRDSYDVRADVWSLGITLVELATGHFPYPYLGDFETLAAIIQAPAPALDAEVFSKPCCEYVTMCLQKDKEQRPKYKPLLLHEFVLRCDVKEYKVGHWVQHIMKEIERVEGTMCTKNISPYIPLSMSPIKKGQYLPKPIVDVGEEAGPSGSSDQPGTSQQGQQQQGDGQQQQPDVDQQQQMDVDQQQQDQQQQQQ